MMKFPTEWKKNPNVPHHHAAWNFTWDSMEYGETL